MLIDNKVKTQSKKERMRSNVNSWIISTQYLTKAKTLEEKVGRNFWQRKPYDWSTYLKSTESIYVTVDAPIRVQLIEGEFISIPRNYSTWAKAIEKSKYIAGYNERDEQSGENIYYDPATWCRSIYLIRDIAVSANAEGYELPAPTIFDGPHGSIDIRWKNDRVRLLVNVPQDSSQPIGFHGDGVNQQTIKGKLQDFEDLKNAFISILKSE